jgi:ATP-dependent Lhr-like helicase
LSPTVDLFASARAWFAARGYTAFPFQEEVWAAYARGESGLVHAATGMGRTYAAALPPMMLGDAGAPERPPPLALLWITPLRALAADTGVALTRAAAALQPHWRIDVRTGDTAAAARARQDMRLPTALVTTTESLTLLLARADWRERFAHLAAVVVDEWHELLSTKRGVQVELALARLRGARPALAVRTALRSVRRIRSREPAARAGRARGAGAPARGAPARRRAVAPARQPGAPAAAGAADAVFVSAAGGDISRHAHHRSARSARRADGVGARSGGVTVVSEAARALHRSAANASIRYDHC